ncbi:MAG: DUF3135 domain-containing protein [Candidatus Thiodiazotropha lotti]|nr:DUF3135 domain-containing protein [Candidatus Thiodiazotropha weberae]MCG7902226.1 DUF3135 domain-containing protein [Candidatus Thiodiazotropha weberae]MCG7912719.1 DUF3135 domain-containing protein [Candidatus Thiodiazotropha weberae]MCG7991530.1 DUF3135 domain-containing protein [Candidatus Thiodiazotropha lotti]MCG7999554.1 DUF3135 domain-containing protein [Candidatus Thiodiazotropha lotti]
MKFEALRQKTIDTYIATLPDERQTQMRRLQWRIDQERRNRSPISACMRISGLMWENMLGPKGMLGYLHSIRSDPGLGHNGASRCEIVEFPLGSS